MPGGLLITKLEKHLQRCFDAWVNKTILKPCLAAVAGHADTLLYAGFSQHKILHISTYTIAQEAIQFRHPIYNPDRAQKLISSSMSRHLSIRNLSSKSMHAFLSNLANRQTDRQTDEQTQTKTFTSSFVGGNNNSVMVRQYTLCKTALQPAEYH